MLDVVIRGGRVADGSGAPLSAADIGIMGDRIVQIGNIDDEDGRTSIDASGLIVCPGFVDVHTHSDITIMVEPKAESAVRQGVTTQVFPNCGTGLAPAVGEALEDIEARVGRFGIEVDWRTVGEYFQRVQAMKPSINIVPMVAQGTVRMAVMGYSKEPPSPSQLEAMKEHVDEAMRSGARGMCSGLRYVPSGYATTGELIELAKVVASHGGLYASHIRSEGDNGDWFDAIEEALAIGRGADLPVQISHLKAVGTDVWGKSKDALSMIEDARAHGLDVMCDQYPYEATSSTLLVLFPQWSQEGGIDAFLERASDPEQGVEIQASFTRSLEMRGGGSRMTVSEYSPDSSLEGKTLAQIAEMSHASAFDTALDLLTRSGGQVSMVFHTLEEDDIERIFVKPFVMVASDGSALAPYGKLASGYYPHPRNYGCFPKVLGDFVRDRGLVSIEEAVRKMTSMPAERFGLEQRGQIQPGWFADVTIFDPGTVADMATFERPQEYPTGISHVIVNGEVVLESGAHAGNAPGKVLFASAS